MKLKANTMKRLRETILMILDISIYLIAAI